MFNITNYERNANQNYNEISSHARQNGQPSESLQVTNVGEGVEKKEPSYTVDENANWCSHYEEQYGISLEN